MTTTPRARGGQQRQQRRQRQQRDALWSTYAMYRTPGAAAAASDSASGGGGAALIGTGGSAAARGRTTPASASRFASADAGAAGGRAGVGLGLFRECTGKGGLPNIIETMIDALYSYAADPSASSIDSNPDGDSPAARDKATTTAAAAAAAAAGDAYDYYASTSPYRAMQRLKSNHSALLAHLAKLASGLPVGTTEFDDGRFIIWVAVTLLRPDGTVANGKSGVANGKGSSVDDNEEDGRSARMTEALDGLGLVIRNALFGPSSTASVTADGDEGGAEPAGGSMLQILLPNSRDASAPAAAGGDAANASRDDDPRSYLSVASQIQSALLSSASQSNTNASGTGGARTKRRKLYGGGYASTGPTFTSGGGSRGSSGGSTGSETSTATSTAVLGYVLASYFASDYCPFFGATATTSADADGNNNNDEADQSASSSATWEEIRACTVHTASSMGLACRLPSIRAGLLCFGLDLLSSDSSNDGDGDGGGGLVPPEGLNPLAMLDLLVSEGGSVVPTLQKMTRHPHPRELIAHVASILLEYIYAHTTDPEDDGYGGDDNDEEGRRQESIKDENEQTAAVVELFRRGTNGESADGYLRTLEALRTNSARSTAASATGRGGPASASTKQRSNLASSTLLVGTKRKASSGSNDDDNNLATSVFVLRSLGSTANIPQRPSVVPVLIEMEALVANADITSAIALCQAFESSPAPTADQKMEGWYIILRYLEQRDMIFDPPKDVEIEAEGGRASSSCAKVGRTRLFHLLQVGNVGLSAIKNFLASYTEGAIMAAAEARQELSSAISPDDIASAQEYAEAAAEDSLYKQFQVRRTMLSFLLSRSYSPAAALKEAEAIATPIEPDGRSGAVVSYVGIESGAPDGDTQALRKIRAILSTRYGEAFPSMYLPRLESAAIVAPAPVLLEGPLAAREAAPAAVEAPVEEEEEEQEYEQEEEEAAIAVDESSVELPSAPAAGAQEVVLLDDSDSDETRSVQEPAHDEREGEDEAYEADSVRGRSSSSESTADESDVVEIIESSSEEEEEVAEGEEEVAEDEEQQEQEEEERMVEEAPDRDDERVESDEEELAEVAVADHRFASGEEEATMSDDMDEADEATAEERSVRDEISDEEEIVAQGEEARRQHTDEISHEEEIAAQEEEARRQHMDDLARQALNAQRRQALSSRQSAQSASDYDDTTAARAGTDDDPSEYFTETSQGTQSGAEYEVEPPAQRPLVPRDEKGDAEPGSILIAAAMNSQRQQQPAAREGSTASVANESGKAGDDSSAAVAGTDAEQGLDDFLPDAYSQGGSKGGSVAGGDADVSELGVADEGERHADQEAINDTDSLARMSMIVNPSDSPKGSVVLEPNPQQEGEEEEEHIDTRAAEKARIESMREEQRRFEDEAELRHLEQERIASKEEAKRLRLEQEGLAAREAERQQAAKDRIETNRKFLAKKRREAEEMRQRELEEMKKRKVEEKRAAEAEAKARKEAKEAAKRQAKEKRVAEAEAKARKDAEEAAKTQAAIERKKQRELAEREADEEKAAEVAEAAAAAAATPPKPAIDVGIKQEDGASEAPASGGLVSGLTAGVGGIVGEVATGMKSVVGMLSPKPKTPPVIDLLDDSDDEAVEEQAEDEQKTAGEEAPAEEEGVDEQNVAGEEEDVGLTLDSIESCRDYRKLQNACTYRGLPARGKADELKDRLRWHLEQERIASKEEAKRLRLEQEGLAAREAERQQAAKDRIETNRKFLAKKRREAEEMRQRELEEMKKRKVEEKRAAEAEAKARKEAKEAAKRQAKEKRVAEAEAKARKDAEEAAKRQAAIERKKQRELAEREADEEKAAEVAEAAAAAAATPPKPAIDVGIKQEDGASEAPASGGLVSGLTAGVGGIVGEVAAGMKSVVGMLSPKPKTPPVIDLLDDSDDEAVEEQAEDEQKTAGEEAPAEEEGVDEQNVAGEEEDVGLTLDSIESCRDYRKLQNACTDRGLPARGKADELKDRLRWALQNSDSASAKVAADAASAAASQGHDISGGAGIAVKQEDNEEEATTAIVQKPSIDSKPAATDHKEPTEPQVQDQGAEEDTQSVGSVVSRLSYREVQQECKDRGLPATGKDDVLRDRLKKSLEGDAKASTVKTGPPAASTQAQRAAQPPTAAAAAATSSRGLLGAALGTLAEGARGAMDMISPKAKKPEVVDMLDASDDEEDIQVGEQPSVAAVKKEEGADGKESDDGDDNRSVLTAQDIDGMSYNELRAQCKARRLGGKGKTEELRRKLKAAIDEQHEIPTSIGNAAYAAAAAASPMSSIASTPDHSAFRARSRMTPSSSARRRRAIVQNEIADPLPVVKEEDQGEQEEEESPTSTARRRGRRRKKGDDEEGDDEDEEARPSPPKRQRRKKAAATPTSTSTRATARSRTTRSSARSTRSMSSHMVKRLK